MDKLSLAQYVMINWTYGDSFVNIRKGNRSVIFLKFTFQRTLGFYFLQIYVPLTIIVMSSWVSFWLVKTNQVSFLLREGLKNNGFINFSFEWGQYMFVSFKVIFWQTFFISKYPWPSYRILANMPTHIGNTILANQKCINPFQTFTLQFLHKITHP